jgi:hypothetical protein
MDYKRIYYIFIANKTLIYTQNMATQPPMGLVGRTGNIIHYRIGDKFYSRAAPRKFKQTKATKRRAGEFGRASGLASNIRAQLVSVIPEPADKKMQGRLVATVFQWLSGQSNHADNSTPGELDRFSFTETGRKIRERWRIAFKLKSAVSGQLQIEIPAFVPKESIKAPSGTVSVLCSFALGVCDKESGTQHGNFSMQQKYEYNTEQTEKQIITINLPTPKSSLVVMAASLEYTIMKEGKLKTNRNKAFMPAGIVDAILL